MDPFFFSKIGYDNFKKNIGKVGSLSTSHYIYVTHCTRGCLEENQKGPNEGIEEDVEFWSFLKKIGLF